MLFVSSGSPGASLCCTKNTGVPWARARDSDALQAQDHLRLSLVNQRLTGGRRRMVKHGVLYINDNERSAHIPFLASPISDPF